jgi:hypothetical protein
VNNTRFPYAKSRSAGPHPYFEILLKSETLAALAKNAEIVAEHIIPD